MNPCRNCGEDVGDATECPNCGRRQYRFAVEDDTTIPPERTEALEDVEDLLRERIDPPPRRREAPLEWQPPPEPDQPPPEPDHGSMPTGEPAPQQDERTRPGWGWTLLLPTVVPALAANFMDGIGVPDPVGTVLADLLLIVLLFIVIRAWIRWKRQER